MNIVIDVIFVLFMALMFYLGYRKGFLSKAWWLIDIALIVAVGLILAPTVASALAENTGLQATLEEAFASMLGEGSFIDLDAAQTASLVLNIIVWVALGIIIIILMAILKAVLKSLRKYAAFKIIDGIFGGLYSVIISLAVLVVLGALVGTFTDFAPIKSAYDLCGETYIFRYVFGANPFDEFLSEKFPLGSWLYDLIGSEGSN